MTTGLKKSESRPEGRRPAHDEILRLAEAMMDGRLSERGNPSDFDGEDARLIGLVNRMLDALVSPLRLAANAIDQISHGTIPPFVIDDYKGEYNTLKQNLNILLATLYGLHNETRNLIVNINEGKLKARGNDWDFGGIWRDLIAGVNGTLDAVTDPLIEAGSILKLLSNYDLTARMNGRYRGEHAMIKKAINRTADALHSAISQVSDSVENVTRAGDQIALSSETVEKGATEQDQQITEASRNLANIAESSSRTAENIANAQQNAQRSVESITSSKEAMERMVSSMNEIRSSADNTTAIVHEIDAIAKETEKLSATAAGKAAAIRSSAGGFGVVATEIQKLSKRTEETAQRLDEIRDAIRSENGQDRLKALDALKTDFDRIITDLKQVSMVSHYLGLNASVAAAHVEVAGDNFQIVTDEIMNLSKRSTDAARRTDELIRHSIEYVRKGETISREIDGQFTGVVEGGEAINRLTEEINQGSREQVRGLDEVTRAVFQINDVTRRNADVARESSLAAKVLEQETKKLSRMVSTFKISMEAP